jgi:outer membrane protein TolC
VDVPLYTSGRIRAGIHAAEARLSAAAVGQDETRGQLKLEVAETYLAVLRAQRELEVCQQAVRSLQSHYRDVQLLFSHQQVPENDLLSARVALADAQQKLIQARNNLDICRSAYNRQLGRALETPVCLAEVEPQFAAEELRQLTEEAIRNRPVITSLGLQAQALQHQAEAVRAKSAPQVTLRGEYAFEENRYRNPEGLAAVGVGLTWNAFDAGRNRHEAAALLHQAESVRRLLLDAQSRVALEVRRAWLEMQQSHKRLEVTAEAIRWADENLRIVRKRYLAGLATNTEVLEAETQRAHASRNHYHALYDAVLAELRLQYATGRLQR